MSCSFSMCVWYKILLNYVVGILLNMLHSFFLFSVYWVTYFICGYLGFSFICNFMLCFQLCECWTCSQHFVLPYQWLSESGRRCLGMRCSHFWAGEGALRTLPAHVFSSHLGVRHLWLLLLGTSEAWGFGQACLAVGKHRIGDIANHPWFPGPPLLF